MTKPKNGYNRRTEQRTPKSSPSVLSISSGSSFLDTWNQKDFIFSSVLLWEVDTIIKSLQKTKKAQYDEFKKQTY